MIQLRLWYRAVFNAAIGLMFAGWLARRVWDWSPPEWASPLIVLGVLAVGFPLILNGKLLYAAAKGDEAAISHLTQSRFAIVERRKELTHG